MGDTMRAAVRHTYGSPDKVELRDIDKPVVSDDRMLVRVHAASVNPSDRHQLTGTPFRVRRYAGLREPKDERMGVDFAGTVEAVGPAVTLYQPGDEVFGGANGAFAEYVWVRQERAVAPKPAGLTFEQAAAVPVAATTALQGLRDLGRVQPRTACPPQRRLRRRGHLRRADRQSVGRGEVTGVCSTRNVDIARSFGTDHVIDYTHEDFTRSGQRYDVLLDTVGNRSWPEYQRVLKPESSLVIIGGPKGRLFGPRVTGSEYNGAPD